MLRHKCWMIIVSDDSSCHAFVAIILEMIVLLVTDTAKIKKPLYEGRLFKRVFKHIVFHIKS